MGKGLLSDERGSAEWSAIYLLIVVVIAAILLFTVVKPSFRSAQEKVRNTPIPKAV
ncbi:MAG TPA: hypothetical protein VJA40_02635 [archaeon]|nr:hypothetical protein [archaeon]